MSGMGFIDMPKIAVALGANMGDKTRNLENAVQQCCSWIDHIRLSPWIETEPEGYTHQPHFLNGVLVGMCNLEPHAILNNLLTIENHMGRVRYFPNGPRKIDLDLIFYDQIQVHDDVLTLPHPRMHLRKFVLYPLSMLEPEWIHPIFNLPVQQLLSMLPS